MKKTLAIIFSFCVLLCKTQNNFLMPDSSNQILFNSKGGVESSSIPQEFMNKFIFPDFINNDLKDAASDQMRNQNYFGGDIKTNFNIMFNKQKKTSKRSGIWGIGFENALEANLIFTKDLFDLAFYGNKRFANTNLDLSKTNFNSLSYSCLEFTFGQSFLKNKIKSSVWGDLGLLIGHNFTDINIGNGSLFTEKNGDYLELVLSETSLKLSDTSNTSLVKGFGAKLDLFYSRQTPKYKLLISAENIGGIFWQNISSASLDTTIKFEGIEIDNIFQLSDSVWSELGSSDSLILSTKKDLLKAIPVNFSAYYRKNLKLISFDVLARYRLFANYIPFIRTGINFNLPYVKPGVTTSYGGYSRFNFGINTDFSFHKSLKFQVGTNNILGSFLPGLTSALDVYLGFRLKFN